MVGFYSECCPTHGDKPLDPATTRMPLTDNKPDTKELKWWTLFPPMTFKNRGMTLW